MINTVSNEEIAKQLDFIEKIKNFNEYRKYHIVTMGCKLNENDSEKLSGMLLSMGYEETENIEDANIVIFNTCCIRENAEEKVFGKLGALKNIKDKNNAVICFAGCMSQEKHIIDKIKKSYKLVDIVFGTHNLYKFPEMLYNEITTKKNVYDIWDIDGEIIEGLPIKRQEKGKANVTIMNGCNNFCSYCIVPYTRGRERSRRPEDIISEVKALANEGYKEIILLGQNVNSYNGGKKVIGEKIYHYTFADLLRDISKIKGIDIIRFISPHPKDFKDDVIDAIAECGNISKTIHIPLQSGSNNVLKGMNRKYTKQQYIELINKIKDKIPNVAFTTDIIVGFPGETEADFEETLDVISKIKFEQVFMFIFSVRKGTKAEKMEGQISDKIKSERFDRLKSLADGITVEENEKYIGTIQRILVEGTSKTKSDMLTGRTKSNKIVNFKGNIDLIGKEVNIKITSQHAWYLKGDILDS
jgi:tRNA-2-methylthio-N6-dimethylallyladenosine synthase